MDISMLKDILRATKDMLKRHEGYRNYVYECSEHKRTIGYGYNIDANPLPKDIQIYLDANGFIVPSHAERLLDLSIAEALHGCYSLFPDFSIFSDNRKMALIDLVFNLGANKARKFVRAIHAINMGDWETAAVEIIESKYAHQVPTRAVEIAEMIKRG